MEALTSVLAQQNKEQEIILVCNASSISYKAPFHSQNLQNVRSIHQPIPGSAYARNAGLNAALGEWIQFLDVDDLLLPHKIFHQIQHEDADVIVSPHTFRFVNGQEESSKWLPEDIWRGLLDSGLGSTSSMLWKRQALIDVGGWDLSIQSHQEYELLFRMMASGKKISTYNAHETIVRQRLKGSITISTAQSRVLEGIELRERIWDYLVAQGMDSPMRYDAFRQYLFRQLRGLFRQHREKTMELYRKYFDVNRFSPKNIHVPGYRLMYRLLGFYGTERLIKWVVWIRDI
jgi:glycosyltransferase involved in cell wall biosynthesis